MEIYKKYVRNDCAVSKKISKMGINLPTTCEIKKEEIERIGALLKATI
jgi:dTDP-4-amino-4,6-dideoxygalactose transaminase